MKTKAKPTTGKLPRWTIERCTGNDCQFIIYDARGEMIGIGEMYGTARVHDLKRIVEAAHAD